MTLLHRKAILMTMNLQKYMALLNAVEYGSFSKAGDILSYSQSGISRMVRDLEEEWNITLLERGKSGVRLTSDGMRLFPYIRKLCNEFHALEAQVSELQNPETGLIRIGTFSSVATHWLPNIIKEFQKDYPKIEYELLLGDYTEIEQWIIQGRVDCGFLRLPTVNKMETILLEEDRLMAILPETHPLASCDVFPMKALCDMPFMLLEKGAKAEITEILERNRLNPDVRFTTWDDYAVMSMVESGLGISILPELILRRLPYKIVAKPLEKPAFRKIGFAVKDVGSISTIVKRFMTYLDFRNPDRN